EPVQIRTTVRKARQLALPVRDHQTERVPAPLPPFVPDVVTLQDHMVDAALAEEVAHRQANLPAADHDNRATAAQRHRYKDPGTATHAVGTEMIDHPTVSSRTKGPLDDPHAYASQTVIASRSARRPARRVQGVRH